MPFNSQDSQDRPFDTVLQNKVVKRRQLRLLGLGILLVSVCSSSTYWITNNMSGPPTHVRSDSGQGHSLPKHEIEEQLKPQTLVVGMLTRGSEYDHNNVLLALSTWLQHIPHDHIVVMSQREDPKINATRTECAEGYSHGVCCKTNEILRRMYRLQPDADWYLRITDDSVWQIAPLLKRLAGFNSRSYHLLGCANAIKGVGLLRHGNGEPHPAGGAGFIFSNSLARWWSTNYEPYVKLCHHDDLSIGHYIRQVLGVVVTHVNGIMQEPDVKELMPSFSDIKECTCPLPPPLYYNSGGWTALYPFTPFVWEEAYGWHMKASVWPSLLDLEVALQLHRSRGHLFANDTLLIFMEAESIRGGTYEALPYYSRENLSLPPRPSLCLLRPFHRVLSYYHCNLSDVSPKETSDIFYLTEMEEWVRRSKSSLDYQKYIFGKDLTILV
eukprot:CAMPEP_0197606082 /NCGR_PEP_ID=MMETSP1326-20131121/44325_1 /TAXON_ID=1155430 /ORGANISM="Genus nov. species nov., Strain RCC2288" /LENGTH=439 /DNA_ID=CAMNT_0043173947 /DNA_START=168 /DNA_END=1487 /DNA_ORIENTATION=-